MWCKCLLQRLIPKKELLPQLFVEYVLCDCFQRGTILSCDVHAIHDLHNIRFSLHPVHFKNMYFHCFFIKFSYENFHLTYRDRSWHNPYDEFNNIKVFCLIKKLLLTLSKMYVSVLCGASCFNFLSMWVSCYGKMLTLAYLGHMVALCLFSCRLLQRYVGWSLPLAVFRNLFHASWVRYGSVCFPCSYFHDLLCSFFIMLPVCLGALVIRTGYSACDSLLTVEVWYPFFHVRCPHHEVQWGK
jgi:branched-subunit amino acid transport protein AzlD